MHVSNVLGVDTNYLEMAGSRSAGASMSLPFLGYGLHCSSEDEAGAVQR